MSMDKAIQSGKEHRKPYRGGKAVAHSCRNHGGGREASECVWCKNNRLHSKIKATLEDDWDGQDIIRRYPYVEVDDDEWNNAKVEDVTYEGMPLDGKTIEEELWKGWE